MESVTVRPAAMSDAEAIAALSEQLDFTTSPTETRARLEPILRHLDHAVFVATLLDGSAVGWVHVFGAQRLAVDAFAELGGLVVDEARRGQGAGRVLMARAEAWAGTRGYGSLRVRSRAIRSEAHAFYVALGYSRIKTQYAFAKTLAARAREAELYPMSEQDSELSVSPW